jgi:hypothetical protein
MSRQQREAALDMVVGIQENIQVLLRHCRSDDLLHDMVAAQRDDWAAIEGVAMKHCSRDRGLVGAIGAVGAGR